MNKICRICLEEGVLSSIFSRNYNVSLNEMIEYCSNVVIRRDDGLPEQLCSNCIYKLGISYHFKQTCESADIRLRQYLGLIVDKRSRDVAVMTDAINVVNYNPVSKCKCRIQQKKITNSYKRKSESEKLKRGPKPKPKQINACYLCEKQFKCQAQLKMHVRTHTGDKPFTCIYCSRRFTQKHNLTIHMRIHTGEKPFQCEVCSKSFSAQGNLQTHLKIHTGQRDHTCSICNKSFITSSELTRHMAKHRGVKDYKCDICGTAFVQSRDLKMHKQKKHQQEIKTVQEECVKECDQINVHEVSHSEKDSITVPLKNSLDPLQLSIQKDIMPVISHHEPNAVVELKTPKHLQVHHYQPDPWREKYSCAICSEEFDFLSLLAQHHSLRHSNYKPKLS